MKIIDISISYNLLLLLNIQPKYFFHIRAGLFIELIFNVIKINFNLI